MFRILETLRTAPPPSSGSNNLLSDASIETEKTTQPWVRREDLPNSPIQYLTSAIDSVAPLIKIRNQRGILGGGQALPIPVALRVKQRRRTAIQWILTSAENNRDTYLADRVAKEIIKVANGTSSVWEKRAQVHRQATTARSNVRSSLLRRRKPR
jgi:small subunit ribosomal protein S7